MFFNPRMIQGTRQNISLLHHLLLGIIILLLSPSGMFAAEQKVIAVGDVHGDLHRLNSVLKISGLIDSSRNWTGGNSILVLTGDFTDRGEDVRQVLDQLIRMQTQAKNDGGELVILFGNHEMMNLTGDLRYVPTEVYATFKSKKSAKLRQEAFKKYIKIRKNQARDYNRPLPEDMEAFKTEWMENHPEGFVEYREAFGPKGEYGKWLRDLPVVAQIQDTIFVHGGLHPEIAELELKVINERMVKERKAFDDWTGYMANQGLIEEYFTLDEIITAAKLELVKLTGSTANDTFNSLPGLDKIRAQVMKAVLGMGSWLSNHPDGPLWYRGYSKWDEEEGQVEIDRILKNYSAKKIVVGHTINSESEITQRFDGRVILIDTVDPTALEIDKGRFTAIYLDKRVVLNQILSTTAVAAESSFD
jgi:hypothetical protein